ncbi:MAG: helix-turn-helix domain-containing protein [Clostridia bacterium]|nr:helix-turn-helix domain-containing protein [Clostridia bacterium]
MFENFSDVLTVEDVCSALCLGKNTAYELLKLNVIKSIKLGRKYLIPKVYLVDFVEKYR